MHLARAVRGQDDDGRMHRLHRAQLGDGDLVVGQHFQQEGLEWLVGTVEFRIGMIAGAAANGGAVAGAGTFRVGGYFENGVFERDLQFTGTTEEIGGAVVPLPAAAWLMLAGLGAIATTARRRKG
jgi:hypothetical protein